MDETVNQIQKHFPFTPRNPSIREHPLGKTCGSLLALALAAAQALALIPTEKSSLAGEKSSLEKFVTWSFRHQEMGAPVLMNRFALPMTVGISTAAPIPVPLSPFSMGDCLQRG